MGRLNAYGLSVREADLADVERLTGIRHADWDSAQAALSAWVAAAGAESDALLVQHFHNWLQRQAFILRGCGPASFLPALDLQPILDR